MKKFFAAIVGIALAVLVALSVNAYQKGISMEESWNAAKNYMSAKIASIRPSKEEAKKPLEEVTVVEPEGETNLSYDQRIEKGDYFMERGFLTFAANEYVKAANLEPNRIEPYLKLIKANFDLGDYDKAKRNAEIILKLDPNNLETRLSLAQVLIKQSDFSGAQGLLDDLYSSGKADARVNYYRALVQIALGNHEDGKKLLKEAKAASEDDFLDKKIEKMLAGYNEFEFTKAAEELYLAELLARGLNEVGEYEMAISKLKDVLRERSDLRDAWILLGFAYLNLEKYYFAQTAFERAYELDSEWPATQYFLGITHAELLHFDDAIVFLNYALDNGFEPEAVLHKKLADLYLDRQQYAESVESYKKVLELNKEDVNAFVRPVWIYLDYLNNPDEALKLAETALAAFPDNPLAYNLLGWSQLYKKDYKNAEKNLLKALELNPNLAAAYYNLGRLYEENGNKGEAMKVYQKAYDLDQNGSIGNMSAKRYNALTAQ
ncbi:tetratricopeptide repeat protein [Candidatus Peregrinibacteria bacterium]|nr:tetratricopeptide repeat protein [Candidatus Peregrinibacteria bacterium]